MNTLEKGMCAHICQITLQCFGSQNNQIFKATPIVHFRLNFPKRTIRLCFILDPDQHNVFIDNSGFILHLLIVFIYVSMHVVYVTIYTKKPILSFIPL